MGFSLNNVKYVSLRFLIRNEHTRDMPQKPIPITMVPKSGCASGSVRILYGFDIRSIGVQALGSLLVPLQTQEPSSSSSSTTTTTTSTSTATTTTTLLRHLLLLLLPVLRRPLLL